MYRRPASGVAAHVPASAMIGMRSKRFCALSLSQPFAKSNEHTRGSLYFPLRGTTLERREEHWRFTRCGQHEKPYCDRSFPSTEDRHTYPSQPGSLYPERVTVEVRSGARPRWLINGSCKVSPPQPPLDPAHPPVIPHPGTQVHARRLFRLGASEHPGQGPSLGKRRPTI